MVFIHVPTVLAFTALLAGCLGALLVWLWRRDRSQPALLTWGIARLVACLALLLLLAARGLLPDQMAIRTGLALVCLSYGLTWGGARQFEGRPVPPAVVLAGAGVWLLASLLPGLLPRMDLRLGVVATILAGYSLATALEFHRGRDRLRLPSRPLVVGLLAGLALIYAGTVPLALLLLPGRQPGSLSGSLGFALLTFLVIMSMAGAAILLVALTKEQAELHSNAALARARDAAAAASAQKTRFVAAMSHELRTPLNGVLGLAQVLARDPALGSAQRDQAATLVQAGQHLLAILNQVLDLSRIEAGRLGLEAQVLPLRPFLAELLAVLAGVAAEKGIELRQDLPEDLPEAVLADPLRLRQILLNLLGNALKFTPAGGRVVLAAGRHDGTTLAFSVTDTGPGVPRALRPRLFQDYAQAAPARDGGGSGLGLAISARLAQAMGGSIRHAEGPAGLGSRFTLLLPSPVVAPDVARPAPAGARPAPGLRVLVVDDVRLNRLVVRALLEQAGLQVQEAADGLAALALLAEGPLPDLVLMDESMPGLDGRATTRRIRALPGPASRLPILAVTANALPEQILASLAAGMDGHVAKPIDRDLLLGAIAAACARRALPVG